MDMHNASPAMKKQEQLWFSSPSARTPFMTPRHRNANEDDGWMNRDSSSRHFRHDHTAQWSLSPAAGTLGWSPIHIPPTSSGPGLTNFLSAFDGLSVFEAAKMQEKQRLFESPSPSHPFFTHYNDSSSLSAANTAPASNSASPCDGSGLQCSSCLWQDVLHDSSATQDSAHFAVPNMEYRGWSVLPERLSFTTETSQQSLIKDRNPTSLHHDPGLKLRTIVMRGLPFHANEAEVRAFFSGFNVSNVIFGKGEDGRPNGEAWAVLATMQEAKRACRMLHKEHLGSRYVELYMSRSPPPSPNDSTAGITEELRLPSSGSISSDKSLKNDDEWTEVKTARPCGKPGERPRHGIAGDACSQKTFSCFNCFETGHISRDCPAPCRVCGGFNCSSASHFAEGGAPIDKMAAEAEPKPSPSGLESLSAAEKESSRKLHDQVAAFLRDKPFVDQGLLGSKFGQKRWAVRVLQRHGGLLAFLRSYPETFTFSQGSQGRASVGLSYNGF